MPHPPRLDASGCAPIRRLLALVALIAIVYTTTASTSLYAAKPNTSSMPTLAARVQAASPAHAQIYLPLFKTPLPCAPLYSAASPWNTKIASSPAYDLQSDNYIGRLTGQFSSDPTQYTFPLYEVTSDTPQRTVYLSGSFSNVTDSDTRIIWQNGGTVSVPIPAGVLPSYGTDANIVFWDPDTGDEWGFWQVSSNADGIWKATNGYHYNTHWDGVPPINSSHFVSRGLGGPYLAGLIRPCEIVQGHIDHALAFAYDNPSPAFVYPATKSNGEGTLLALPEGARLQLDPNLTDAQIQAWGCTGNCLLIAHAMQQYGLIVVDYSDRPKIYVEDVATAGWNDQITAATVSPIPYWSLRVISLE